MLTILKRELKGFFYTSTAYVFIGFFLSLGSLIFYLNNMQTLSSDLSPFLSMMSYVWMLLCPVLVIRLISGERKQMTEALLLTSPLGTFKILMGKFTSALLILALTLLLSAVYPLIIAIFGYLYWPELLTAYFGFFLQGCSFLALDLFISSFMNNTVSAFAAAFGINLLIWLISLAANALGESLLSHALRFISLYDRFVPFLHAQFSFASLLYYGSFIALMLYLSMLSINWRKGRS